MSEGAGSKHRSMCSVTIRSGKSEQVDGAKSASPVSPNPRHANRFGSPPSPVAVLSPACCLPVAFPAHLAPCSCPVASVSLLLCSPVAPLSLSCCYPAALLSLSCRFMLLPVVFCCYATFRLATSCRSPIALLLLQPVAFLSLFAAASLRPSCRLRVLFLLLPCCLPVASLSLPCCPTCYPVPLVWLACRLPVAVLLLPYCLLVAPLSSTCRFLSPNAFPCLSPVPSYGLPVAFLSAACRLPVAFLSPAWRFFGACWSPLISFPFASCFTILWL